MKAAHDIEFIIVSNLGSCLGVYRGWGVMDVERIQVERVGISNNLEVLLCDLCAHARLI